MQSRLRIGTRGSKLALAQTDMVIAALARAHGWSTDEAKARTEVVVIKTTGDKIQDRPLADIGGKGLFAKEIEEALFANNIDCAVHSLKDLPAVMPDGLTLACMLPREDPRDAFVSRSAATLSALPKGAVVGTSSVRRRAMLAHARPDLQLIEFRGNVDTRLRKLDDGIAQATVLALAGLKRLHIEANASHIFSNEEMLPAVAQGAIGIEIRSHNDKTRTLIAPANHRETDLTVTLERAFQATLDGSCRTPIAGLATWRDAHTIDFSGCVLSPDGAKRVDVARPNAKVAAAKEAEAIGIDAGRELLSRAGPHFFTV